MRRFIIRRFVYSLLALLGVTLIVFMLSRVAGDPRAMLIDQSGYGLSEEAMAALAHEMRLDEPIPIQYAYWLGGVLRGDLGTDWSDRQPVTEKIFARIPNTLKLGLSAWIVATVVGIPLGVLSAVKRGSFWDYLARMFAVFGITLPTFFVAIMAILLFSVQLRWLPVGGTGDGAFDFRHWVLPVATLAWAPMAGYLRLMRSAMLEILDSEYVKLARAKGVGNNKVIWKHAVRNSLIVPVTVSALLLAGFITGTVVTEVVFAWPGLGRLAFDAVVNNNIDLVAGTTLVFGAIFIVANFLVDLSYMVIDPRIRLQ